MLPEEAVGFVRDVLGQFRVPEFGHLPPYFPFTEDTCRVIIDEVSKKDELKPRAIMHAFNAVLQEADPKMEAVEINIISPEFAKRVLVDYVVFVDREEN